MRVVPQGTVREPSVRYYAVKVTGVDKAFAGKAFYSIDGSRMEAPLYCVEEGRRSQVLVTSFPNLPSNDQTLELQGPDGRTLWRKRFSPRVLDIENSITCRLRPELAHCMRHIELRHTQQSAFIEPVGTYPFDAEHEVLRIHVVYPEGVQGITLDPAQVLVNATAADAQLLECGRGDDGRHHITMSYRFRKDEGRLIFATPGGAGYLPWIFYLSPRYRGEMIHEFAEFTGDAARDTRYPAWFDAHRATHDELAQQRAAHLAHEPLMSIVIPVYQAPLDFLQECVGSVCAQTYAKWELVVVNADPDSPDVSAWLNETAAQDERIRVVTLPENRGIVGNTNAGIQATQGDFVCFLDQDDLLEPNALFAYVAHINAHPQDGALYCDEDSLINETGVFASPRFKPDFNRDSLYAHNYVVHMLAVRRDVLEQIELSTSAVEGAQDFDLTLKASEIAPIGHVAQVLYHWRCHEKSTNSGNVDAKPYAIAAGVHALEAHFARRGIAAAVEPARSPYTYRVTYEVSGDPLVSIIIPTKDHVDLLDACVTSLLATAGWENLEVLVIENNSTDPATFAYYDELVARDARIRLLRYEGAFNYSKIINWAAAQAQGSYLLLLNNDTQALTDNCIREMLGYFQRPEVGVVGPLLLFPDGLVQTAGLALMRDGRLGFLNQNLTLATHGGYLASLECPRDCSAVLGAAQMVSKALFDQLGGYNEELVVTYNDVDFCWRVREAGKLVVYTPHAQLSHREFATRGRDSRDAEHAAQTQREAALMRTRWSSYFEEGDPVLNPNCDPASPWFKLPHSS